MRTGMGGKEMWKQCLEGLRSERGNVMLMGGLSIIVIIMFAGGILDLGLYYERYQSAKEAISLPIEEVEQMFPLYAYDSDPQARFRTCAEESASDSGWGADTLTTVSLNRAIVMGGIRISTEVVLTGQYECFFLPLLGFDTLPIRVRATSEETWNPGLKVWTPGSTYYVWTPTAGT